MRTTALAVLGRLTFGGLVFFYGRWLLYCGMADSKNGVAEHRP